ncbi:MAG: sulfatase [Phycisphaerae bacterium]
MSVSRRISASTAASGSWLCAFALSVLLMLGLPGCEQASESPAAQPGESKEKIGVLPAAAARPNIVMILVDALRADRLGAYGHRGGLTPTMDSIAAAGVTFDHCVAPAPWTLPSVATLFTSYYPGVHKATSYRTVEDMEQGKRAYQSVLSDEFDTLAEVLQAAGYQTVGFVACKFLRAGYGFGQGFEHYDTDFADNTVRGELVNAALFRWLDENRHASKPLFLYLHYMDVHGPYNAASRFMDPLLEEVEANPNKQLLNSREFSTLNRYLKQAPPSASDPDRYERLKGYREYWVARYEAGVMEMDFYLSQLVQRLQRTGLWDDAYVILLADHGEALCEHGKWDHGYSQFQTDLRVPLILRWPNVLPAGKRVRRLASLIDLMPTLLEQLRLPPGESLQGTSLVDHISDRLPDMPLMRFAEALKAGSRQYALFAEHTKLVATSLPPRRLPDGTTSEASARYQLFNLATDPDERYNISDQSPEVVKRLGQLMHKVLLTNMKTKPGLVVRKEVVDSETARQLESLGYVGSTEDANDAADIPQPESQPAGSPADDSADDEDEPTDDEP